MEDSVLLDAAVMSIEGVSLGTCPVHNSAQKDSKEPLLRLYHTHYSSDEE